MFIVNLESITFKKVKIIIYLGKLYIIARRNVLVYSGKKKKYRYTNYMQVMFMRLMSKSEYLIVPTGTKLTGSSKLGLSNYTYNPHIPSARDKVSNGLIYLKFEYLVECLQQIFHNIIWASNGVAPFLKLTLTDWF